MRSPQTTGVDEPLPGISTFQRTFFVSLHSIGGVACGATPVMSGPRHWGQKRSASAPLAPSGTLSDKDGRMTSAASASRFRTIGSFFRFFVGRVPQA
jgi:hypothetical protein